MADILPVIYELLLNVTHAIQSVSQSTQQSNTQSNDAIKANIARVELINNHLAVKLTRLAYTGIRDTEASLLTDVDNRLAALLSSNLIEVKEISIDLDNVLWITPDKPQVLTNDMHIIGNLVCNKGVNLNGVLDGLNKITVNFGEVSDSMVTLNVDPMTHTSTVNIGTKSITYVHDVKSHINTDALHILGDLHLRHGISEDHVNDSLVNYHTHQQIKYYYDTIVNNTDTYNVNNLVSTSKPIGLIDYTSYATLVNAIDVHDALLTQVNSIDANSHANLYTNILSDADNVNMILTSIEDSISISNNDILSMYNTLDELNINILTHNNNVASTANVSDVLAWINDIDAREQYVTSLQNTLSSGYYAKLDQLVTLHNDKYSTYANMLSELDVVANAEGHISNIIQDSLGEQTSIASTINSLYTTANDSINTYASQLNEITATYAYLNSYDQSVPLLLINDLVQVYTNDLLINASMQSLHNSLYVDMLSADRISATYVDNAVIDTLMPNAIYVNGLSISANTSVNLSGNATFTNINMPTYDRVLYDSAIDVYNNDIYALNNALIAQNMSVTHNQYILDNAIAGLSNEYMRQHANALIWQNELTSTSANLMIANNDLLQLETTKASLQVNDSHMMYINTLINSSVLYTPGEQTMSGNLYINELACPSTLMTTSFLTEVNNVYYIGNKPLISSSVTEANNTASGLLNHVYYNTIPDNWTSAVNLIAHVDNTNTQVLSIKNAINDIQLANIQHTYDYISYVNELLSDQHDYVWGIYNELINENNAYTEYASLISNLNDVVTSATINQTEIGTISNYMTSINATLDSYYNIPSNAGYYQYVNEVYATTYDRVNDINDIVHLQLNPNILSDSGRYVNNLTNAGILNNELVLANADYTNILSEVSYANEVVSQISIYNEAMYAVHDNLSTLASVVNSLVINDVIDVYINDNIHSLYLYKNNIVAAGNIDLTYIHDANQAWVSAYTGTHALTGEVNFNDIDANNIDMTYISSNLLIDKPLIVTNGIMFTAGGILDLNRNGLYTDIPIHVNDEIYVPHEPYTISNILTYQGSYINTLHDVNSMLTSYENNIAYPLTFTNDISYINDLTTFANDKLALIINHDVSIITNIDDTIVSYIDYANNISNAVTTMSGSASSGLQTINNSLVSSGTRTFTNKLIANDIIVNDNHLVVGEVSNTLPAVKYGSIHLNENTNEVSIGNGNQWLTMDDSKLVKKPSLKLLTDVYPNPGLSNNTGGLASIDVDGNFVNGSVAQSNNIAVYDRIIRHGTYVQFELTSASTAINNIPNIHLLKRPYANVIPHHVNWPTHADTTDYHSITLITSSAGIPTIINNNATLNVNILNDKNTSITTIPTGAYLQVMIDKSGIEVTLFNPSTCQILWHTHTEGYLSVHAASFNMINVADMILGISLANEDKWRLVPDTFKYVGQVEASLIRNIHDMPLQVDPSTLFEHPVFYNGFTNLTTPSGSQYDKIRLSTFRSPECGGYVTFRCITHPNSLPLIGLVNKYALTHSSNNTSPALDPHNSIVIRPHLDNNSTGYLHHADIASSVTDVNLGGDPYTSVPNHSYVQLAWRGHTVEYTMFTPWYQQIYRRRFYLINSCVNWSDMHVMIAEINPAYTWTPIPSTYIGIYMSTKYNSSGTGYSKHIAGGSVNAAHDEDMVDDLFEYIPTLETHAARGSLISVRDMYDIGSSNEHSIVFQNGNTMHARGGVQGWHNVATLHDKLFKRGIYIQFNMTGILNLADTTRMLFVLTTRDRIASQINQGGEWASGLWSGNALTMGIGSNVWDLRYNGGAFGDHGTSNNITTSASLDYGYIQIGFSNTHIELSYYLSNDTLVARTSFANGGIMDNLSTYELSLSFWDNTNAYSIGYTSSPKPYAGTLDTNDMTTFTHIPRSHRKMKPLVLENKDTMFPTLRFTNNNQALINGEHYASGTEVNNMTLLSFQVMCGVYVEYTLTRSYIGQTLSFTSGDIGLYIGKIRVPFVISLTDTPNWGRDQITSYGISGSDVIKYPGSTTDNTGNILTQDGGNKEITAKEIRLQVGLMGDKMTFTFIADYKVVHYFETIDNGSLTTEDMEILLYLSCNNNYVITTSGDPLPYRGLKHRRMEYANTSTSCIVQRMGDFLPWPYLYENDKVNKFIVNNHVKYVYDRSLPEHELMTTYFGDVPSTFNVTQNKGSMVLTPDNEIYIAGRGGWLNRT